MQKRFILATTTLAWTAISSLSLPAHAADADAKALVAGFPPANREAEIPLYAQILDAGANGMASICALLVPPGTGDDTQARYALSGLASYVSRPGAEAERTQYVGVILGALKKHSNKEVRAFLVRRLARAGKAESVEPLGRLLSDSRLREPAAQALVSIGSKASATALAAALKTTPPEGQVTLINSLGALSAHVSDVTALTALGGSSNKSVRDAALDALAEIAAPGVSAKLIGDAAAAADKRGRPKAFARWLRFAERLADRDQAAAICRSVLETSTASHEQCAALSSLVQVLGPAAQNDLLRALDKKNAELTAVALQIARRLPGEAVTNAWVEQLKTADDALKPRIVQMLGRRKDPSALTALREALKADDVSVKLAAVTAISRLENTSPLASFLSAMQSTTGKERAELLSRLAQLGGKDALDAVVAETKSQDELVRSAAVRLLTDWPELSAMEPIFSLYKNGKDADRLAALRGYLRLVRGARLPPEEVFNKYNTALAASRTTQEQGLLLEAFAHLKTEPSLKTVSAFLEHDELQQAAASAVIRLVLPRRSGKGGLDSPAAATALKKAIAVTKNDGDRKRAEDYLTRIESR